MTRSIQGRSGNTGTPLIRRFFLWAPVSPGGACTLFPVLHSAGNDVKQGMGFDAAGRPYGVVPFRGPAPQFGQQAGPLAVQLSAGGGRGPPPAAPVRPLA